jgi:hypothetical protein
MNVSELERGILVPLPGSPLVRKIERFFAPLKISELLQDVDPERRVVGGRRS